MQASAPAFFNVPQDAVWRNFSGGVGFLSGLVIALWLSNRFGWTWPTPVAFAFVVGIGAGLFSVRALRTATGALRWDGASWSWVLADRVPDAVKADAVMGRMTIAIDAGRWMLLIFKAQGESALWLPVSSTATAHDAWHSLRALLYSRRSLHAATEVVEEAAQ